MSAEESNPTVFVVDDDNAVRDSLRWLIESVGHPVETYENARAFLDGYDRDRPGCLVLDVRMPGMSGLDLQEYLIQESIHIPVIIITGHGDVPMAVRAMKAGALDFVEKPFSDQVLLERIERALEKDTELRAQFERLHDVKERFETLTPREREVMEQVVAGHANKVIAYELDVSMKTVEAHRGKVMRKMRARSLSDLVKMSELLKKAG
ncbi:MAG: response regulator FixJ [Gammaproteobacteria bacterium]